MAYEWIGSISVFLLASATYMGGDKRWDSWPKGVVDDAMFFPLCGKWLSKGGKLETGRDCGLTLKPQKQASGPRTQVDCKGRSRWEQANMDVGDIYL